MEGATVTESGRVGAEPEAKRIDIISDTHGHLSPALLEQLEGADLIIHAGDITSEMDWEHLCTIAPIRGVLGNNDYYRDYGPEVQRLALFTYEGLRLPWPIIARIFLLTMWTLPYAATRIVHACSRWAVAWW